MRWFLTSCECILWRRMTGSYSSSILLFYKTLHSVCSNSFTSQDSYQQKTSPPPVSFSLFFLSIVMLVRHHWNYLCIFPHQHTCSPSISPTYQECLGFWVLGLCCSFCLPASHGLLQSWLLPIQVSDWLSLHSESILDRPALTSSHLHPLFSSRTSIKISLSLPFCC